MEELRAWDYDESRALGLDAEGIASTFYPGDSAEVRSRTSPPGGCFLVALEGDAFAGGASYRPLEPGVCEMHDVYARPAFRGRGIGRKLVERLLEEARAAGYRVMRLETATFMPHAQRVYGALGFEACKPYRSVPAEFVPITIWMERAISGPSQPPPSSPGRGGT